MAEQKENPNATTQSSIPLNPFNFPIDFCMPVPDDPGMQLCVKSSDVIQNTTYPCEGTPGGRTPPLTAFNITYAKERIFTWGGQDEVVYKRSVYIGFEQDGRCIWVGEPRFGQCARVSCDLPEPAPTKNPSELIDDVREYAVEALEELEDMVEDTPSGQSRSTFILILAAAIVLLIIPGPQPI